MRNDLAHRTPNTHTHRVGSGVMLEEQEFLGTAQDDSGTQGPGHEACGHVPV